MRIEVSFDITTTFTVADTGYTTNMSLPEIEEWAKRKTRTLSVYLKEGASEPKLASATVIMKDIRFVPDKGK